MKYNLRTLKDILHPTVSIDDSEDYDTDWNSVDVNDLRGVAKEWIDSLDIEEERLKDKDKWDTERGSVDDYRSLKLIRVRIEKMWIKYFFNIE